MRYIKGVEHLIAENKTLRRDLCKSLSPQAASQRQVEKVSDESCAHPTVFYVFLFSLVPRMGDYFDEFDSG